ncbi:MAG TPA: ABC transporter ATP-binding protein [Rubrobacteraceae bacterium]|nr:ABC transporter ATP-binding protein [Rubrobacteraceae bacterium]
MTAETRGLGRRILTLFRPYRLQLALIMGIILFTSGLSVISALLIRTVFDHALFPYGESQPNLKLLYWLVGVLVFIPIFSGVLNVAQTYLTNVVGNRVMRDLRDALFGHLQRLSLAFFTSTRTGEVQSRLANDVGGVQETITTTAASVISNVVVVCSTLVAMLILSLPLTALSLLLVPVFVVLANRVGIRRRSARRETQISLAEMSAITQESLSVSGILLAKVFGRQQREIDRYRTENTRQANLQVRQAMVGRSFFALTQAFFGVSPALLYLVAGLELQGGSGAISAGTLVAFTTLQTRLLMPINQLLQVSVDVQSSLALFGRIFEYLDLRPQVVDAPDAIVLDPAQVRGEVALEDVYFRYGPSERDSPAPGPEYGYGAVPDGGGWALQGVSLSIEPGQLAALVGPSGAGKTTISYLIPRLYDVTSGAVRIDGYDVRKLSMASLASICGVVTQESYLFHATVRENLRYGRPEASDAEVEAAARAAYIHDRISALPQGYGTVVGERGYRFSGGERQRLAIARVILKDPRVLLLDEATSALDTESERIVQQALDSLMQGRTSLVIAHRLSTIRTADVIFVIERGRVVERGTHGELLAYGGLYARLYEEQFGGGEIEAHCADGVVLTSGRVARPSRSRRIEGAPGLMATPELPPERIPPDAVGAS